MLRGLAECPGLPASPLGCSSPWVLVSPWPVCPTDPAVGTERSNRGHQTGWLSKSAAFNTFALAGLPRWHSGEEPTFQCRRPRSGSLGQEDPVEESMATPSGFLPGDSHGQRSLAGYSPWSLKESDTTEVTQHACTTQAFRSVLNLAAFGVPVS